MASETLRSLFYTKNYVKSTVWNCKNHDQKHHKRITLFIYLCKHVFHYFFESSGKDGHQMQ